MLPTRILGILLVLGSIAVAGLLAHRGPINRRIVPISLVWDEGNRTLEKTLLALDAAGQAGADLACLPQECVYQGAEPIPGPTADAIAAKAAKYKMYVVGNLRERDGEKIYITSFLCDRKGKIVGKYRKSHRLPYEEGPGPTFTLGDDLPVFATDFGRICTKICLDVAGREIDQVAGLNQVDLVLLHTQDAGPFNESIRMRDYHRALDNGYFLLRAAGGCSETSHRTFIMDPWGTILGATQFRTNNEPVMVTLQLDNRPKYYEWPEEVRRAGPYPEPVKRGIPAESRMKMYGRYNRPVAKGDLRAVVLGQRRPELYKPKK